MCAFSEPESSDGGVAVVIVAFVVEVVVDIVRDCSTKRSLENCRDD